ncbi:MAG: GNAT family N-acetyltransferase [Flavobacteriales bacterium]|nr:MAG: GNAT family N-acetyltransferase [Flavobacteriales bacterium]
MFISMAFIRFINTSETYPLRIKILRNGQAERYTFEQDNNATTFHLGAFSHDTCVGIATFFKDNHPYFQGQQNAYQLRGMAVDDAFQSQGIGRQLITCALAELTKRNSSLLWCNARQHAIGFYRNMGFQTIGEEFIVPHIGPHIVMFKDLRRE